MAYRSRFVAALTWTYLGCVNHSTQASALDGSNASTDADTQEEGVAAAAEAGTPGPPTGSPDAEAFPPADACCASDGGASGASKLPSISIVSPKDGATVAVIPPGPGSGVETITVSFAVSNFMVMPAGTCPGGGAKDACGHVLVFVDGSACTPSGQASNNVASVAGPVAAILSSCPSVDGAHTVSLELHADDGGPINGPGGTVVSAQATFTATGG